MMLRRVAISNTARRAGVRGAGTGVDPGAARGAPRASSFDPKGLLPAGVGLAGALACYTVYCRGDENSKPATVQSGKPAMATRDGTHGEGYTSAAPTGAGSKSKSWGNEETRRQTNPDDSGRTNLTKTDDVRNLAAPSSPYPSKANFTKADNLSLDGGSSGSRDGQAMTDWAKRVQESGARETGKVH
jgi:hypothetical protein